MKLKTKLKKGNFLKVKLEKENLRGEIEDFMADGNYEPLIIKVDFHGLGEDLEFRLWPSEANKEGFDITEETSAAENTDIDYDAVVDWIISTIYHSAETDGFGVKIKIKA